MEKMLATVVFGTAILLTATANATTGADLAEWCKDFPDGKGAPLCASYVGSTVSLLRKGREAWGREVVACVPEEVALSNLISIISRELNANNALKEIKVGEAVEKALQPDFPCTDQQ